MMTKINWYPGHMKKTKELIADNLKLVDMVLEVVDARVPLSSKNPDIAALAKTKKRVILLNKSDLVISEELEYWKKYFIDGGYADFVLDISAETGHNLKKLFEIIENILEEKKKKNLAKGIQTAYARMMVAGIPNVGKSRLINVLVGKKATGVRNTPGFTKGKQWVKIKDGIELLDMPGVLWPKFEDERVGLNLAISGAIKDDILNKEGIAIEFIKILKEKRKTKGLKARYKMTDADLEKIPEEIIEIAGRSLGYLMKEGKVNTEKASITIIKDYREGRLGKFGID